MNQMPLAGCIFREEDVGAKVQANPLILVFTADVDFYLFVDHAFQAEGLLTQFAVSLDEALRLTAERGPDAILLDCRNPAVSASKLCAPFKQNTHANQVPIVALMDQGAEREYVDLIKTGIDDTLIRPVWPAKLIERMHSVLKTGAPKTDQRASTTASVRYADLEMDLATYRVHWADREIHLSPTEFKLLRHFLEHPEEVVTRAELHSAAWRNNVHVGPRTVDVHVGRLRKALRSGSDTELIRTVRSVGYALSVCQNEGSVQAT